MNLNTEKAGLDKEQVPKTSIAMLYDRSHEAPVADLAVERLCVAHRGL